MDKVLCPYCENEMELEHLGSDDCEAFIYACHNCGASSPLKSSEYEATQAALHRPLQKPLTLEDVREKKTVWLEDNLPEIDLYPIIYYEDCFGKNSEYIYFIDNECSISRIIEKEYGKTWRCWATKPTNAERMAIKLDD